jgi:hypothetical protein
VQEFQMPGKALNVTRSRSEFLNQASANMTGVTCEQGLFGGDYGVWPGG